MFATVSAIITATFRPGVVCAAGDYKRLVVSRVVLYGETLEGCHVVFEPVRDGRRMRRPQFPVEEVTVLS